MQPARKLFYPVVSLLALVLIASQHGRGGSRMLIHDRSFEDFRQGTLEDGGANTYISQKGAVEIIPRWDFNNDGQLDLLMSQDHNPVENVDAFLYWGGAHGYQSLFPPFWKELPAFDLVKSIESSRKRITFLPTFGGGPVKVVDLNRDGYPDIVFPNTIHNYSVDLDAYVYWGSKDGYSPLRRTDLPTKFALDVTVADFNRDGYPDLVFANFGHESGDRIGYRQHLESYIYWGSPEGYSVQRRTSIPTESAVSCASGDFNGDGWPDLAFVNNNARHRSIVVYWGGAQGFAPARSLRLEGGNPGVIRAADLNGDHIDDLIVCSRDAGAAVYPGSSGFRFHAAVVLPAQNAMDVVAADFNRDGYPDLAFASQGAGATTGTTRSDIFWGSASGFDAARRLTLPTLSPRAVAAADLNGDGYADLVFANFRDADMNNDVPAFVYWGGAHGFESSNRSELQGFGAVGVTAADLNGDGQPDILLMNQLSGRGGAGSGVGGRISSVIFWGNASHTYSEVDATLLPTLGPYFTKVADLNDDGYPDIVFTGSPSYIYWGSPSGFQKRTQLDISSYGVAAGDINRDGYLDLVFSIWPADSPRNPTYGLVLWGGEKEFSLGNSVQIPLQESQSCCGIAMADLNQDGFLDLVFPSATSPNKQSEILWGSAQGLGKVPSTLLATNGVDAPAVADLDGDGWLDLIFPGTQNTDTMDPHTSSLIYWGSSAGYSEKRRTELEAFSSQEVAVADLNHDGYLDLVVDNYKAASTRSLPIFIYWGNAEHRYSNSQRTELPAESSCGIQILDLNQDGYPEIIVHNHIKDGDHAFGAYIYWGHAEGYSIGRRTRLPTMGTHHSMGISPGNIYTRSPGHGYQSRPVELPAAAQRLTLTWKGDTPHKTSILFQIRTAPGLDGLQHAEWKSISPGAPVPLPAKSARAQYRAVLNSPDGGRSPLLREVTLSVE